MVSEVIRIYCTSFYTLLPCGHISLLLPYGHSSSLLPWGHISSFAYDSHISSMSYGHISALLPCGHISTLLPCHYILSLLPCGYISTLLPCHYILSLLPFSKSYLSLKSVFGCLFLLLIRQGLFEFFHFSNKFISLLFPFVGLFLKLAPNYQWRRNCIDRVALLYA